ncbi:YdfR family protein [Escherichia coli]|nr:YdfR family protein [Escherichia coli]EFW7022911.1 YdfR family protein [Shigella sonnei]EII1151401.1 YdfR family protein [Escherichia coli O103]EED0101689.1 YdfR family protein [Escherichia coli]EED1075176.1 YdfR family protein [Escherichia coli]
MKKKYELGVKGINNYPDKITVTVALEIGGYPSLLLPDVAISLDRTEGATLEFYEAEAKKQAKQFFMDIAAGLCEGDEPLPEKRPVILDAQDVLITYKGKLPGRITGSLKMPPSTLRSEKDDVESRIEKLECYIAELKKSTPTKNEVLAADEMKEAIPDRAANLSCASWLKEHLQQPEKKRRDEQFAAFYDYCRKVMSRNLAECFRIQKNRERSANSEILDNFLKGTHLASDCFIAHSFGGFHEAIKHDVERSPGILCSIPVSIEIDTNTITGELVTAGVGIFRHEGNDAKGSFTKIGPFFLKVER